MRSRLGVTLCLCVLWSCGGSDAGSDPGALVDNTKWVWTTDGEELFGAPPPDSVCELMPIDCPEFPWPEGECVTFDATSACIASFVPECFPPFTVMAVYTRMPNPTVPLCNWLTLEQPSLRAIRAGDEIEVRMRHAPLNAPVPGEARMSFAVGDALAFDERILIPAVNAEILTRTWTAPKDYPADTPLLFHVENHGANEYMLIEARIL
jgi:hypothetical protein